MASVDLSVVSSIGLAVVTGYAVILRYTFKRERETLEAKIAAAEEASKAAWAASNSRVATVETDARAAVAKLDAALAAALGRIVELEKNDIRRDGDVKLLRQAHDGITRDLDEIKRQQVPRAEWERQMTSVVKTLDQILERLDAYEARAQTAARG